MPPLEQAVHIGRENQFMHFSLSKNGETYTQLSFSGLHENVPEVNLGHLGQNSGNLWNYVRFLRFCGVFWGSRILIGGWPCHNMQKNAYFSQNYVRFLFLFWSFLVKMGSGPRCTSGQNVHFRPGRPPPFLQNTTPKLNFPGKIGVCTPGDTNCAHLSNNTRT